MSLVPCMSAAISTLTDNATESPSEFHDYNFSYDVIQDSIRWMRKEVNRDFELRNGFFQYNA